MNSALNYFKYKGITVLSCKTDDMLADRVEILSKLVPPAARHILCIVPNTRVIEYCMQRIYENNLAYNVNMNRSTRTIVLLDAIAKFEVADSRLLDRVSGNSYDVVLKLGAD